MKKILNLLIVEDNDTVLNGYRSNIKSYNKTNHEIEINITECTDKDKALAYLKNLDNEIDGAIVDLDLKNSGGNDSSGNDVIREIKENLRFPVFVISGTIQNIDDKLKEETDLFKVRDRDDPDFEYIDELVKIYNTGITLVLRRKGKIENYINEIFWKHLSNSLGDWVKDEKNTPEQKEKSLLRYTLLHLQEYLDINSSGDLEKYNPSEFLITEPIKPYIFTGDILKTQKGKRCIILTPACDIDLKNGNRKADKILTLRILNPNEIDSEFSNKNMSKGKMSKIKNILKNSDARYHCIPKSDSFNIGIIDFQDKFTINDSDLEGRIKQGEVERIATVSHPFLKDIISRYSNYYSRQGSPDFDQSLLFESLF